MHTVVIYMYECLTHIAIRICSIFRTYMYGLLRTENSMTDRMIVCTAVHIYFQKRKKKTYQKFPIWD